MDEREHRPRAGRVRGLIAIIAAAVLVAAGLIGGGWLLGKGSGGQRPGATGGATVAPTSTGPSAAPPTTGPTGTRSVPTRPGMLGWWRKLPDAPVPPGGYTGVWTGRELIVQAVYTVEPYALHSAAAAYSPASGTWRPVPPAPGPVLSIEGGEHAVWTGTEMLSWGMLDAGYNPSTNHWRRLAAAPVIGPSVTVWTGREVLMWGGGCCETSSANGAAYDPRTDRWQVLPAAPLAGRHTSGAWTGRELLIVGGERVVDNTVFADAAAYNPTTRTWRKLPDLPAPRSGATATWTGTEVYLVGGYRYAGDQRVDYADGLGYDPVANRWRRLPSMGIGRTEHAAVWTGRLLLVVGGITTRNNFPTAPPHGVAYDPASNRWLPMPVSPLRGRYEHIAEWTGSQLLVWGGYPARASDQTGAFTDGAAFTPYPR